MSAGESVEDTLTRMAVGHLQESAELFDRVRKYNAADVLRGMRDSLTEPDDAAPPSLRADGAATPYAVGWYIARGLAVPKPKRRRKRKPMLPGDGP